MFISRNIKIIIGLAVIFFVTPFFVIAQTANDPLNEELYYLNKIHVESAWDYTTGSKSVVVAVIDTGIDIDHPDIFENIWVNVNEADGDGIDNDDNGYIDDIHGWDFIRKEADPNPKFDAGYSEVGIEHGTLVAGVIGARGNNDYGVSGLNWQVSLMSLTALDGYGNGNMQDVVEAIEYATANGADIINMSLVGPAGDGRLAIAIKKAYEAGVVIVAAVGNESVGDDGMDNSINLVTDPRYPVCLDGELGTNYVLGVGSINFLDKKSLFSNYGTSCIDINAPGEFFYGLNIYQPTFADYRNKFSGYWSGTSLATPLVAGTAALLKAFKPHLTNQEIYNLILDNADNIDLDNLSYSKKLGKGKLNLQSIFNQAKNIASIFSGTAVSSQGGFTPHIYVYNDSGEVQSEFLAFDEDFTNGINLAVVRENNINNIIASQSIDGQGLVRVYNTEGSLLNEWNMSELAVKGIRVTSMKNRVLLWSEDFNNRMIYVYTTAGELLNQFVSSGPIFDIVGADSDEDGVDEINILSSGKILVYNQLGALDSEILLNDNAGSVAIGDGVIVTGAHSGQSPKVVIYNLSGEFIRSFYAYNVNFYGGLDVDLIDDTIVTGAGKSGGPHLRAFDLLGNVQYEFFTLDKQNNGGINIQHIN
jgi:Subtilase family